MRYLGDDTIIAPATIPGTGAITVLRVSGPQSLELTDKVVRFRSGSASAAEGYTVKFGVVHDGDDVLDEVLVTVFRAPHSYTGEDSVEISCHASSYIAQQIEFKFIELGARAAEPGEFTRRAFASGKMDLAQAEAVADVIAASSASAHRVAMNQMRGGYSETLRQMRDQLLDVTSLMELELDFSEEDVEFADRSRLIALVDAVSAHVDSLTDTFRLGNAIKNGVPVAIVGAANTGKSTLLNALLGEDRAIVSPVAGTTRDTVEETFNLGGTLFRLIDTAGIRETQDEIEALGIGRSIASMEAADIVIGVLDVTLPEAVFAAEAESLLGRLAPGQACLIVVNKIDEICSPDGDIWAKLRVNKNVIEINKIVSSADCKDNVVFVSAKTGFCLRELKNKLVALQNARIPAGTAGSTLVTNARHYNALCAASRALSLVRSGLACHTPTDLVAQDLREVLYHLGTITGEISTDEVLGNIFRKFCIGK